MGKWKMGNCPRCGGSTFIDSDMDGWYEQCINCSYRNELKVTVDPTKELARKEKQPSDSSSQTAVALSKDMNGPNAYNFGEAVWVQNWRRLIKQETAGIWIKSY